METEALRKKVIEYVNEADESTLRMVSEMFENYISTNIIAFTSEGKPLSKEEYISGIKAADASIDKGEFTRVEDLEKEIRNW